jgi:hypothetical protein
MQMRTLQDYGFIISSSKTRERAAEVSKWELLVALHLESDEVESSPKKARYAPKPKRFASDTTKKRKVPQQVRIVLYYFFLLFFFFSQENGSKTEDCIKPGAIRFENDQEADRD